MAGAGRGKMSSRDRRTTNRYPIVADLEYRLIRRKTVVQTGRGRTVNFSSTGLLFESPSGLGPGLRIEMSIFWPARLLDVSPLKLCVAGRTVRAHGNLTAVRILSYEFRTRAVVGEFAQPPAPRANAGGAF